MKIFIISEGDDVGGVAIAIQRAFERYGGDWEVRTMRGTNNYIDYPVDLSWDPDRFTALWDWADVIHAMEKVHNLTPHRNPPGKPLVMHHHGTIYRNAHGALDAVGNAHNLVQLCSTIDLTWFNENVVWLPNPIDVEWMQTIRHEYRPSPPGERLLRFVHTPTQRWEKHTAEFIEASTRLGIQLELVEKEPWSQALARKATGDVLLDQLSYGYGLSGLEAWAMEMPVVGGTTIEGLRGTILEKIGYLPYFETTEVGLLTDLIMMTDPAVRAEYAERGCQYVNDFHSQPVIVERLKELYTEAVDRYEPEGPWP